MVPGFVGRNGHVGIVVPGDEGDLFGSAEGLELGGGLPKLLGQCDVGEIAGDRKVVWALLDEVPSQRFENLGAVQAPATDLPRQPAKESLSEQGREAGPARIRGVPVAAVGKGKHVPNPEPGPFDRPSGGEVQKLSHPPAL